MRYIIAPLLYIALSALFVACGNNATDENTIRVGIVAGPEKEIAETAKKVAKEQFGLEVELVTFNDYVMPNEALSTGDIDANAFQHVPYLTEQSKQRGYQLAVIGNTFVYPIIAYSKKIKSLDELVANATVAIPNDPTNGGRSLLMLQEQGLITLKDNTGIMPKVIDITSNPKNLRILELEAPQLPKVLDDKEVTIAIINNNFAAQAGLDPDKLGLFRESKDSPYVNVIVTREDNKDLDKVKRFLQAYQSNAVEQKALELFKGQAIKGW
ncbi:methionine ABC transporter substrate-binding lipoprotein MetQ [Sphingobacterium sp. lm-10]|uniref:methionine ABC transporter substrate-binding lipoprotein MetQ n=1 Tax=Sphingobacterium sp. lm-10 TaxID=2944904 RepID=UPI00202259B8|nr:methionine ABC transporter substrate-binding lipoprotein MetQ [Sphingobacterium sp. lm-10]MCL7986527.1 methionine ABC transporter substrate-binding lipoprotein MetQ [Sphingobacterium sp. lm-10]